MGSVIGSAIGGYALVVVVALGPGTMVERSAPVHSVIKPGGAAYPIFLGAKAVRARPAVPKARAAFRSRRSRCGARCGRARWSGRRTRKASCSSRPCCPGSWTGTVGTSWVRCCFSGWPGPCRPPRATACEG
ncbi:hypothetical protein [Streptomyces griseofuscus]|uniref:hypothetical protein n=1 Tax=Streptomyces griseofuscus TaxID=146922 RepID=UPI001FE59B15|nr:hypothetical protein [Streptomyces griseofuscus]